MIVSRGIVFSVWLRDLQGPLLDGAFRKFLNAAQEQQVKFCFLKAETINMLCFAL